MDLPTLLTPDEVRSGSVVLIRSFLAAFLPLIFFAGFVSLVCFLSSDAVWVTSTMVLLFVLTAASLWVSIKYFKKGTLPLPVISKRSAAVSTALALLTFLLLLLFVGTFLTGLPNATKPVSPAQATTALQDRCEKAEASFNTSQSQCKEGEKVIGSVTPKGRSYTWNNTTVSVIPGPLVPINAVLVGISLMLAYILALFFPRPTKYY